MKVVWLCNYSLKYLKDKIDVTLDFNGKHPLPWLYYLVSEISNRGDIELHVITLNSEIDKDYDINDDGIHYHIIKERAVFVPIIKKGRISKRKIHSVNLFWKNKVLKLINSIDPDIINIHGTEGALQVIGNEINKPSVVWMQGLMNFVTQLQQSSRYSYWLENENSIIRNHNHFITFPGEMEDFIKEMNKNAKFYNIYHPNPEYVFDMFHLDITPDADLIYVGEIVKRKGIEDYIELNSKMKKKKNIKSKIIGFTGNNEYLEFIKNKIRVLGLDENIKFVGYMDNHSDVLMEIKKSRMLVLPTYVDTGPRTVAESMTVGTPVVTYNVDGLPEMITNNFSGMLVECGDVNKLFHTVSNLLNNEEKIKQLTENAYNTAKTKYSPEKVVDKLVDLYTNIINQSHSILA